MKETFHVRKNSRVIPARRHNSPMAQYRDCGVILTFGPSVGKWLATCTLPRDAAFGSANDPISSPRG